MEVATIHLEHIDNVWCRVHAPEQDLKALSKLFSYTIKGAGYGASNWDGVVRLMKKDGRIHAGLAKDVYDYAVRKNLQFTTDIDYTHPGWSKPVTKWYGKKDGVVFDIEPWDYQRKTLSKALRHKRALFLLPTATGKSLVIYTLARDIASNGHKVLILVPEIGLVNQLHADFQDYAWKSWPVAKHVGKIYGGKPMKAGPSIFISTFQSMMNKTPEFLSQFGAVIGDEAHRYKSDKASKLLEKLVNCEYRYGLTGTIGEDKGMKLVLEGLFGSAQRITTTAEQMDLGRLAQIDVKVHLLNHAVRKKVYVDEIEYLMEHEGRNRLVVSIASRSAANTLVLCSGVSHCIEVHRALLEACGENKRVHLIHGEIPSEEREAIRKEINSDKDVLHVVVGTFGTCSTGINIPSVGELILAHPFKAEIRTLQSIGRALRAKEGMKAIIHDIGDRLMPITRSRSNHTFGHLAERLDIYNKEGFPFTIQEYDAIEL